MSQYLLRTCELDRSPLLSGFRAGPDSSLASVAAALQQSQTPEGPGAWAAPSGAEPAAAGEPPQASQQVRQDLPAEQLGGLDRESGDTWALAQEVLLTDPCCTRAVESALDSGPTATQTQPPAQAVDLCLSHTAAASAYFAVLCKAAPAPAEPSTDEAPADWAGCLQLIKNQLTASPKAEPGEGEEASPQEEQDVLPQEGEPPVKCHDWQLTYLVTAPPQQEWVQRGCVLVAAPPAPEEEEQQQPQKSVPVTLSAACTKQLPLFINNVAVRTGVKFFNSCPRVGAYYAAAVPGAPSSGELGPLGVLCVDTLGTTSRLTAEHRQLVDRVAAALGGGLTKSLKAAPAQPPALAPALLVALTETAQLAGEGPASGSSPADGQAEAEAALARAEALSKGLATDLQACSTGVRAELAAALAPPPHTCQIVGLVATALGTPQPFTTSWPWVRAQLLSEQWWSSLALPQAQDRCDREAWKQHLAELQGWAPSAGQAAKELASCALGPMLACFIAQRGLVLAKRLAVEEARAANAARQRREEAKRAKLQAQQEAEAAAARAAAEGGDEGASGE